MNFIGIDPGVTGAVAFLDEKGSFAMIYDTPRASGAKEMDFHACAAMLMLDWSRNSFVTIEQVHLMPGFSVVSGSNFIKGYGVWLGIMAALAIPYDTVAPRTWMGMSGLPARDKTPKKEGESAKSWNRRKAAAKSKHLAALMAKAKARWPECEKWNNGRVAACWLAEYGRRQRMGEDK